MTSNNKPLKAVIWVAVSSGPQAADDKISLDMQEKAAREFCVAQGYQVIAVLKVDGITRSDPDLDRLIQFHLQKGNRAYYDLREMWRNESFDIFIAYDDTRISRGAYEQIVKSIIYSGASIYRIVGGWITENDVEFQAALGGIKSNAGMKELARKRNVALDAKAAKGLPPNSIILLSHKLLRDEKFQPVKLVVADEYRQLWQDAATLLLEGMGWTKLSIELYRRYGHVSPRTGRPFPHGNLYQRMMNPTFWGHTARHFTNTDKVSGRDYHGLWMVEQGHPIPEGVIIHYNTHEPVFGPDDPRTELLKSEFRRRAEMTGHRSPNNTHRFSGLIICAQCGRNMVVHRGAKSTYTAYYCAYRHNRQAESCPNRVYTNAKVIQQWIDERLREAIAAQRVDIFQEEPQADNERANIEKAIQRAEQKARRLVMQQAENERDELADTYRAMLDEVNRELKRLRQQQSEMLTATQQHGNITKQRQLAMEEIARIGVTELWEMPEVRISQLLHMLFGNRRLVIDNGEIVGNSSARSRRIRGT